jgi:type IV pilus assembly protein PilB
MTKKIVRPINVAQAKAIHFGYEFVNLSELRLTEDVISAIPRHVAKRFRAIPVAKQDKVIAVALADPSDLDVVDTLQRLLKTDIELRVATDDDIDAALNRYYA